MVLLLYDEDEEEEEEDGGASRLGASLLVSSVVFGIEFKVLRRRGLVLIRCFDWLRRRLRLEFQVNVRDFLARSGVSKDNETAAWVLG
jgi:hypothetical protein